MEDELDEIRKQYLTKEELKLLNKVRKYMENEENDREC